MTYCQPRGFRVPATTSLTQLSRTLERYGWPLWREEVVKAVATVTADLLASPDDRESVYQKWSHNQISEADLVLSHAKSRCLVYRAAEFLDVGHGMMHKLAALPLPVKLDLRCRAQLMDDPEDPQTRWTYILFGTEHSRLEDAFAGLEGIEDYPVSDPDDFVHNQASEPGWEARSVVWDRVLAPYSRSSPLSISAPEPQITFDIAESIHHVDKDAEFEAEGQTTVTAVVAEVARMLGDKAPSDLHERLIAPITD